MSRRRLRTTTKNDEPVISNKTNILHKKSNVLIFSPIFEKKSKRLFTTPSIKSFSKENVVINKDIDYYYVEIIVFNNVTINSNINIFETFENVKTIIIMNCNVSSLDMLLDFDDDTYKSINEFIYLNNNTMSVDYNFYEFMNSFNFNLFVVDDSIDFNTQKYNVEFITNNLSNIYAMTIINNNGLIKMLNDNQYKVKYIDIVYSEDEEDDFDVTKIKCNKIIKSLITEFKGITSHETVLSKLSNKFKLFFDYKESIFA